MLTPHKLLLEPDDFFLPSLIQPYGMVTHRDPDNLSWTEAMADTEHLNKWIAAARAEITVLEANETWDEVSQSSTTAKIIHGTWVFHRKRTPNGEITKYKARFCFRGDLFEEDSNTYAP
jgi:hypothetical protein